MVPPAEMHNGRLPLGKPPAAALEADASALPALDDRAPPRQGLKCVDEGFLLLRVAWGWRRVKPLSGRGSCMLGQPMPTGWSNQSGVLTVEDSPLVSGH